MVFDPDRALARGLEVLRLEAEALQSLSGRLGPTFQDACKRILACEGRVVLTGMGKAGLIGQKISATLASTGSPSLWLHPADALHGDLGRLRDEDVVVALSMSGKTRELVSLVAPCKAIGASVIAITGSADSPLGKHADLVLELGALNEACPLGLAPTVTTTAMLAMGDALAMAVQEGREFTRDEFARFHPAGDLGRKLMKVSEIMRQGKELPLVSTGASLRDTVLVMSDTPGRPGAALIVDAQGALLGIFTDGDLRRAVGSDQVGVLDLPVDGFMAASPRVVRPDQLVEEAQRLLTTAHIDQIPVVTTDGSVVGLLDVQDLLEVRL